MGIEYRQVANHSIVRQKVHRRNPKRILPRVEISSCQPESVWWMFDGTLWWQSLRGPLERVAGGVLETATYGLWAPCRLGDWSLSSPCNRTEQAP